MSTRFRLTSILAAVIAAVLPMQSAHPTRPGDAEAPTTFTLVAPGFERAPAGPDFIFRIRSHLFGVSDPVAGKIVFVGETGAPLGSLQLPSGFRLRDVEQGEAVVLRGDAAQISIARGIDPARPAAAAPMPLTRPTVSYRREGVGLIVSTPSTPGERNLMIQTMGQGRVLTASFIGRDAARTRYAYWEQETPSGAVRSLVGRFSTSGQLAKSAPVDLSTSAAIPALPAAVDDDGTILTVIDHPTTVSLVRVRLGTGKALGPAKVVAQLPTAVLQVGDEEGSVPTTARRLTPSKIGVPYDPARGAEILARARAFETMSFNLTANNLSHPGVPDLCQKTQQHYWRRPGRYNSGMVGQRVSSAPYKWGGFDSVDGFAKRIGQPEAALAGSVCTCKEEAYNQCVVAAAAGVDCSGFVSRAWGLKSHLSTGALMKVSYPLGTIDALRPGDALDDAGSHVRLFIGFDPGPRLVVRVIESAVGGCNGGVCENTYTPQQLVRYAPIRYKG